MTDAETLARRYPWSQYPRKAPPPYATRDESLAWHKAHSPFTVDWIVPDSSPGLYGWRSETRSFATEEAALAAAQAPMGIAKSVTASRWNWDAPVGRGSDRKVAIYERKNSNYRKARRR